MANYSVIDIHSHPDTKSFLSANNENARIDCWQNISFPLILKIVDRIMLGSILESQSSLKQINSSPGKIAITGLYAMEKAMLKGDLFNILGIKVNLMTIAGILEIINIHNIIDYNLVRRMSKPLNNYHSMFWEVQNHMLASRTINPGYNLLEKIGDYDQNRLNLILSIEGGHNLFSRTYGCNLRRDVLANLRNLKSGNIRYLSICLAHLERNRLCTHAFGIKLLNHRKFKPVGRGITSLGKDVIREALRKDPKRILIDVKHMSLEARKQFYKILETEYSSEKIPIIMSHGGTTGVSYRNMPIVKCKNCCRWTKVQYKQPEGLMGTNFYPMSVNLYDEEITTIIESEGLIGLSLDKRILGTRPKKQSELMEYFSIGEFNCRRAREQVCSADQVQWSEEEISEQELLINEIERLLKEYIREVVRNPHRFSHFNHLLDRITHMYNQLINMPVPVADDGIKYLCNNILHIVNVAGSKAWKHICIGSDFDALINVIDCCRNTTQYNQLSFELKRWLPLMAGTMPGSFDVQVDDIMYRNVYNFLNIHFN